MIFFLFDHGNLLFETKTIIKLCLDVQTKEPLYKNVGREREVFWTGL